MRTDQNLVSNSPISAYPVGEIGGFDAPSANHLEPLWLAGVSRLWPEASLVAVSLLRPQTDETAATTKPPYFKITRIVVYSIVHIQKDPATWTRSNRGHRLPNVQ
jgi:hypothetical protein